MKEDTTEKTLRERFTDLRSRDEQTAPAFDAIAFATARKRSPFAGPWFGVAAAAAILLAIAGPALFTNRPLASDEEWQSWTAMSDWRATTDTLLDVPETSWKSSLSGAEITVSETEVE